MKVFLSYSSLDKTLAGKVKEALEVFGLGVFLAHEDIEPSSEWVDTILDELEACHVFMPVLTDHFPESKWTDQETGIAFSSGKLVVPLKVDFDPYGFISRYQALKMDRNRVEEACYKLAEVIAANPELGDEFREALVEKLGNSSSYSEAADNAELLRRFEPYSLEQVVRIIGHTIRNRQIYESYGAQWRLRNLVNLHGESVDGKLLMEFEEAIREE